MKLIVNGNSYQNPRWEVSGGNGTLRLATEDSFGVLTELFDVTEGAQIIQTDDDDFTIGIWYAKGMVSIRVTEEGSSRIAEIVYAINSLPEDVADGINASIEESTDAIMELAEMTDEVKTMMERNEAQFEERDTRLSNHDKQFSYVTETLIEYDGRMNTLADHIARLKNLIGG